MLPARGGACVIPGMNLGKQGGLAALVERSPEAGCKFGLTESVKNPEGQPMKPPNPHAANPQSASGEGQQQKGGWRCSSRRQRRPPQLPVPTRQGTRPSQASAGNEKDQKISSVRLLRNSASIDKSVIRLGQVGWCQYKKRGACAAASVIGDSAN